MSSSYSSRLWVHILTLLLVLEMLSSCGSASQAQGSQATPSPFRFFIALQICLDNSGSFPPVYRVAAQKSIAARINSLVQPNSGGMAVFVTQIAKSTFQNDVLDFSVPAIQPLPTAPAANPDPYKNAAATKAYKKALQAALDNLNAVKAQVKHDTDSLRNLQLPAASDGTDIPGCLDDASEHFSHVSGSKVLLIVSDMQNNINTQFSTVNLQGVVVRVLYRVCEVASDCQKNDSYWRKVFMQYGSASVNFYDPAESDALHETF